MSNDCVLSSGLMLHAPLASWPPPYTVQRQESHLKLRERKSKFQNLTQLCPTTALALSTVSSSPLDGAKEASSKDLPPVSYQVSDAPVLKRELALDNSPGKSSTSACPCRMRDHLCINLSNSGVTSVSTVMGKGQSSPSRTQVAIMAEGCSWLGCMGAHSAP